MDNKFQNQLSQLKGRVIADLADFRNKEVYYFDYPVHTNIGDHLIYQGALEILKANGNRIAYQFCTYNYNKAIVNQLLAQSSAPSEVVFVFHGGGNFGDIYFEHQRLREKVITDFEKQQIVVLPQSVFFKDEDKIQEKLTCFARNNVRVHVRDAESFEVLKRNRVDVRLTPDCAHALYPMTLYSRSVIDTEKKLVFRRRDIEKVNDNATELESFDWDEIISPFDRLFMKGLLRLTFSHKKAAIKLSALLFSLFSRQLCKKATVHFSKFDVVDTDRLHGFLLAFIMCKKTKTLDNVYGKIRRYKSCWNIQD